MHRKGTCFHFTGIQNDRCAIAVAYESVRDNKYRLPCLTLAGREPSSTKCPQYRDPTDEEVAESKRRLKEVLGRLRSGQSPCCGAPLDESRVTSNGNGPRFCTACKKLAFLGCNPGGAGSEG